MAMTRPSSAMKLPREILYMVVDELGHEKNFNALYNVALTCRFLAFAAFEIIYQYVVGR